MSAFVQKDERKQTLRGGHSAVFRAGKPAYIWPRMIVLLLILLAHTRPGAYSVLDRSSNNSEREELANVCSYVLSI